MDLEAIALVTELCRLVEGVHNVAYKDPVNKDGLPITNGVGATRDRDGNLWKEGDYISDSEVSYLLTRDVSEAYWPLGLSIPYWQEMNAHQRAAIADLNYNEGYTYGDKGHDTLDAALERKDWDKVGIALQLYDNQDKLGLSRRRYAEWLIWNGTDPKVAYDKAWAFTSVAAIMQVLA